MVMADTSESGPALATILAHFAQPFGGEGVVREVLKTLQDEGHVYTTIDDFHFKHTG